MSRFTTSKFLLLCFHPSCKKPSTPQCLLNIALRCTSEPSHCIRAKWCCLPCLSLGCLPKGWHSYGFLDIWRKRKRFCKRMTQTLGVKDFPLWKMTVVSPSFFKEADALADFPVARPLVASGKVVELTDVQICAEEFLQVHGSCVDQCNTGRRCSCHGCLSRRRSRCRGIGLGWASETVAGSQERDVRQWRGKDHFCTHCICKRGRPSNTWHSPCVKVSTGAKVCAILNSGWHWEDGPEEGTKALLV